MESHSPATSRRSVLGTGLLAVMWAALLASYGTFASTAVRFLFPARRRDANWMFVCDVAGLGVGASRAYQTPEGARITVARQGSGSDAADFVALSSVCPHLGCQVHWEGQNDRFFCPCHNGTFAPDGRATGGPPAESAQDLSRYQLKVEKGLLFMDVPRQEGLAGGELRRLEAPIEPTGPGHDPVLMARATARRDGTNA